MKESADSCPVCGAEYDPAEAEEFSQKGYDTLWTCQDCKTPLKYSNDKLMEITEE